MAEEYSLQRDGCPGFISAELSNPQKERVETSIVDEQEKGEGMLLFKNPEPGRLNL